MKLQKAPEKVKRTIQMFGFKVETFDISGDILFIYHSIMLQDPNVEELSLELLEHTCIVGE